MNLILHVKNMQIIDIFHNCPEEEEQKQSDPKDLGSKFPWSKNVHAGGERVKNGKILST